MSQSNISFGESRTLEWPQLAQSGHPARKCPLSGVKRTWRSRIETRHVGCPALTQETSLVSQCGAAPHQRQNFKTNL